MMVREVRCILERPEQTERAVTDLRARGFADDVISVLLPEDHRLGSSRTQRARAGVLVGSSMGAVIGGALGWWLGIGSLVTPGVTPFIAAGPVLAAALWAAVGVTLGGVAGAFVGEGVPAGDTPPVRGRIKESLIVISVHTHDPRERELATGILQRAGGREIEATNEAIT